MTTMDYKYIQQLLERYWRCETSLEEEAILRSFFAQDNVPAELKRYQPLFHYQSAEVKADVLGEDFDEKVMQKINRQKTVKARVIRLPERLRPLYKAAAVVAIFVALGTALQVPYEEHSASQENATGIQKGSSVAISGDSASVDTLQHSSITPDDASAVLLKE